MAPARAAGSLSLGRLAAFVLLFALLQATWQGLDDERASLAFVRTLIVAPAAEAIRLFAPDVVVSAFTIAGARGGGIRVLNGCDGMDLLLLMSAAVLVVPLAPRARLRGLLVGLPVAWLVNELRLVALFAAARWRPDWFETLHSLLLPLLSVLCVVAAFAAWLASEKRVPHVLA